MFRPFRSHLDSSFSLSSSLKSFLITSSPCRFPPFLDPRSSCRIDHGYSAIVFDLSCSYCGCRLQENFACLPLLLHTLLKFFFSFFFLSPSLGWFSLLFIPFFFLLSGMNSHAVAPSSGLSRFLPPSALSFILEMGIGIHETKLMITTSKQRAERPTATCRAIYKSHSPSTSLFHVSPIYLFADFFSFSLVLLRSISISL